MACLCTSLWDKVGLLFLVLLVYPCVGVGVGVWVCVPVFVWWEGGLASVPCTALTLTVPWPHIPLLAGLNGAHYPL